MNPSQQEVVDLLGARDHERPTFDAGLRVHLRAILEEATSELVEEIAATLHVNKHSLSSAHGCEARFLADKDNDFVVSIPVARGTVAHKAIELSVHWPGDPSALELVDEAIARLTVTDHWLADFLGRCTDADRAELRAEANDRVATFMECWPPLKRRWLPVTESATRLELHDALVILRGKVDLTLGRSRGLQAGKVLIDFKTGGSALAHRDDLRFYALLETIRVGVPPRLLASYYLDQGRFDIEEVNKGVLETAAKRTADGICRIVELLGDERPPTYRAGPSCRWCPLISECDTGRRWIANTDR